jgi:RNA polymerase sigma-70 factor, ECF subfamily
MVRNLGKGRHDGETDRVLTELVVLARGGDEEAFASLTAIVGDHCMAIAFRILRDIDLAEDAVQSSFVIAWRELRSLRDPDKFEAWLHRLLVRACYAEARRSRKRTANLVSLDAAAESSPDLILNIHDRDELERAFRKLPADQRAVLVFRYYLGLTVPELSERLGIPEGTAKSRLHYAATAMRAALEADARAPGLAKENSA